MTQEQILQVQKTWAHLEPRADELGKNFYERLFEQRPDFAPLFRNSKSEIQGERLMRVVETVVMKLGHLEEEAEEMNKLGKRHDGYGVKKEYFEPFCAVLLETIATSLPQDWSPELEEAWSLALKRLSGSIMSHMEN